MPAISVILCPTARLARNIQYDISHQHIAKSNNIWPSPMVYTLSQWLQNTIEIAILSGELNLENIPIALNGFNEQLLWEETIVDALQKNSLRELFDISGLAKLAMEANRYMIAWQLKVPHESQTEEARHFLYWQHLFQQKCSTLKVLETVRYVDWQLNILSKMNSGLPQEILFVGFDQTAPQEKRLRTLLHEHGVKVSNNSFISENIGTEKHIVLKDRTEEIRAVVAWSQQHLTQNPQSKLAIVVPQLTESRNQLAELLDDVFYPQSVRPSMAEIPRNYNFSLGTPLIEQPLIQVALNSLRLLSTHIVKQEAISQWLLSPFFSANYQEADARATLDKIMREKLPLQMPFVDFVVFATQQHVEGLPISQLLSALESSLTATPKNKHLPSDWTHHITALLKSLQWPGERHISSVEFQTIQAWHKALQQLSQLDVLGKKIFLAEAIRYLQQICKDLVFQIETKGEPNIQILGIMEALSSPVDALWVMHMNDHIWPPPAHPNPLIPAFIQRGAQVPGADNQIQTAFASNVHQRLLHSAKQIIFSSHQMEGETQLRSSPMLANTPITSTASLLATTLAEKLTALGNTKLSFIEDQIAPAMKAGEHVSGGTSLFKAQATCPAWGFYQYRLGAKALKNPSNGLDNLVRGSLVHVVLEHFWKNRHFTDLRNMSENDFKNNLQQAVSSALNILMKQTTLSQTLIELEQERLIKLVGDWLKFEQARGIEFHIIGCEQERKVHILGIEIKLKVDRIHTLKDGGLEFVDYKTGQLPKTRSWGELRITEPQLPIYACFFNDGNARIAGVQFGLVKTASHEFNGINQFDFEDTKNRKSLVKNFANWEELLRHWRHCIEAIAQEIQTGEASVRIEDEHALMHCEVLPIMRLPERQLQFERFSEQSSS